MSKKTEKRDLNEQVSLFLLKMRFKPVNFKLPFKSILSKSVYFDEFSADFSIIFLHLKTYLAYHTIFRIVNCKILGFKVRF